MITKFPKNNRCFKNKAIILGNKKDSEEWKNNLSYKTIIKIIQTKTSLSQADLQNLNSNKWFLKQRKHSVFSNSRKAVNELIHYTVERESVYLKLTLIL